MEENFEALQEKYRNYKTEKLRKMLECHVLREDRPNITLDQVHAICAVLSERHPPRRSNEEAFAEFVRYYAPRSFRIYHRDICGANGCPRNCPKSVKCPGVLHR